MKTVKIALIIVLSVFILAFVGRLAVLRSLRHRTPPAPSSTARSGTQRADGVLDDDERNAINAILDKRPGFQPKLEGKKTEWSELAQLNYRTGKATPAIKELESATIKIPGFIVPLTDDFVDFSEFLIVPDPQACIHAPAPPPNQILYVKLDHDLPAAMSAYPFWFYGKLKVVKIKSFYGSVSYTLNVQRMQYFPYDASY